MAANYELIALMLFISYQNLNHYVAHIKKPCGQWLLCDDNRVVPIEISKVGMHNSSTVTHVLLRKKSSVRGALKKIKKSQS